MRLLDRLFRREATIKIPRGFFAVSVANMTRLTHQAVQVTFDIPVELHEKFAFLPGQHINIAVKINGQEQRRSYSICSQPGQSLSIAVKEVADGFVSKWINQELCIGDELWISPPNGHFLLQENKNIVAIAAGSGITPIMSMAYEIEQIPGASMNLFFINKTERDILFRQEIDNLSQTKTRYFLTQEQKNGFINQRLEQDSLIELIKENLSLLKSEGFFICGPEGLIQTVKTTLELFGVPPTKIHFELFATAPVDHVVGQENATDFKGTAKVTVILDEQDYVFEMKNNQTILDAASKADADPPYSCRGGVCSTCRAKLIKGTVKMDLNYTLTDKEIEQGYILTCQSHPTSEEIIISYDQ